MDALLLAGHGSLRAGSGAAMIRLAARLRERGAAPLVGAGFLNYSRPTLGEALARLAARGARRIVVLPYFLVPGYFTRVALPRALSALAPELPACTLELAEPLGAHPALAALVALRAHAAGATPGGALLLAAHGSPDPAANRPIEAVATLLGADARFSTVGVAYLGLNAPSIPAAIDAQVAAGQRQVTVVPYLLQLGGHAAEDVPALVAEARRRHPNAAVLLAAHLGYDPLLAEVLAARASQGSKVS